MTGASPRQDFGALSSAGYTRTRWWWVRHAPVRADGGRIYGQSDPPCDCSDRPVFERLARLLPRNAAWVASHLLRTQQTAEAIWAAGYGDGVALHRLPELAEQDLGTWQGEDRAAFFASRVPSPSSYWFASAEERAPGGESFTDVVARVGAAVERLTGEYRGRDIVAVGHGGSIRAAMVAAMGMTPQRVLGVAVENCSVSRFDHYQGEGEAGWRTVMINHQPWLDGGGAKESAAGADKPA
jgi:broad specificity phosphatase PhoE